VVAVRIFAEGGGEGPLLDTLFRQGWSDFFKKAGFEGRLPRVVRGQGRQRTYDLFKTAVSQGRPGELPLLLVDSEEPVAQGRPPWEHLKRRDGWDRPSGATDAQAFLMVQVMETWFIADPVALRSLFGSRLREQALPARPDVEALGKVEVYDVLKNATRECSKPYTKGKLSFELLGKLNPRSVEARCPHARDLLDRLRATLFDG
jgi:hypothetical protein